jgi:hypothetical protein
MKLPTWFRVYLIDRNTLTLFWKIKLNISQLWKVGNWIVDFKLQLISMIRILEQ